MSSRSDQQHSPDRDTDIANRGRSAAFLGARLKGKAGREYWRSLDELSEMPEFRHFLTEEFPVFASMPPEIDRRSMLKVMAASLALAGLAGCDRSADEKALPYVEAPEFVVPGKPKWYATAVTLGGYAQPVLGKTFVGRPVKLEGNPDHPACQGVTDAFTQAALLGLYDPERSQAPRFKGNPASWTAFDSAIHLRAQQLDAVQGEGFALLTGALTSPTLIGQIAALRQRWPRMAWHVFEPINENSRVSAASYLCGVPAQPQLYLQQAEVIVSFDDDLLGPGPHQSLLAARWAQRRRAARAGKGDSLLYAAEPTPSITGSMADRRLAVTPARAGVLLMALAEMVRAGPGQNDVGAMASLPEEERHWLADVAEALRAHPGKGLVTAGSHLPADLQAFALALNQPLGGLGTILRFASPIVAGEESGAQPLELLLETIRTRHIHTLAIMGANPVYAGPAGIDVAALISAVEFSLHAGLYDDETAAVSTWHLPLHHELESWGDARAADGTVTFMQPLVRPLYDTRSCHGLIDSLTGGHDSDHDILRRAWQATWGDQFAARWPTAVQQGFSAASTQPEIGLADIKPTDIKPAEIKPPATQPDAGGVTAIIRPDPSVWDGRFANNAWLQELPKPLSKITWGNAILVSPQWALAHRLKNGDEIRLETVAGKLEGPIWIMPGQADGVVTLSLGYGRRRGGAVLAGLGYDAYVLADAMHSRMIENVALTATGNRQVIATTQQHQAMDGFDFVRVVQAFDSPAPNDSGEREDAPPPSFYAANGYAPDKNVASGNPAFDVVSWGMVIDLDLCIGCNACVIACMAENNIPVVGKEQVTMGREMHWLRIDQYHAGPPEAPRFYVQPVPCMHCEQAPCEMGCPVNAAVHSFDGLNLQVYNRCIGTRTCSSYCPYKVRRFNWFDFTGDDPESLRAMRNPDVTIRQRGVMEKCTYCVQRISEARIAAEIAGRPIGEGEVVTACQQACPTQAIVFGNIKDPDSAVSRSKRNPRNYALLEEVNTRPRTTYLARVEPVGGTQSASRTGEG